MTKSRLCRSPDVVVHGKSFLGPSHYSLVLLSGWGKGGNGDECVGSEESKGKVRERENRFNILV